MRLNFKAILIATVTAIMASSCVEGSLELRRPGLEDVDATKVELTTLKASDAARVRPFYMYELTLASADESVVLDAKFVSDVMQLDPATFTASDMANAHRNTFVIGNDGSTLTVDGVVCPILSGNLKVTAEAGAYTVAGLVEVSVPEQKASVYYELAWAGEPVAVKFPELPTQKMFTQLLGAESNLVNERNTVCVTLATDGVAADGTGNGEYLVAEFYSADGFLAAGTYTPSKNPSNPKPGEYVIGFDGDFYNVGVDVENVGTCWWTVKEGVATAQKITAGDLYVAFDKQSKEYTIDIDNGVQFHRFVGEIAALTAGANKPSGGGYTGIKLTTVLGGDVQDQYKQAVIQFATDGITVDATTGQMSGSGTVFNLTIHAEGTATDSPYIPTGQYDVDPESVKEFTWQETGGMDLSEYGMGFMYWGTYISEVVDGVSTITELHEGTIWIGAKNGEYIFNYENGDVKFRYTGKITGLVTPADDDGGYVGEPEGEGEGGEDVDYVVMPKFLALSPNQGFVSIYIGQDNQEYSAEAWGVVGAGEYFKFDIYSADGTLAPGTYTPSAEGGVVTEGTFGIGWDPGDIYGIGMEFTNWGTCLMTKAEDGSETGIKIEDGTIEVEEDGGNYVIKVKSSAANVKYEGPLQ